VTAAYDPLLPFLPLSPPPRTISKLGESQNREGILTCRPAEQTHNQPSAEQNYQATANRHQSSNPQHSPPGNGAGVPVWENNELWQTPRVAGDAQGWGHRQNGLPPPPSNSGGGDAWGRDEHWSQLQGTGGWGAGNAAGVRGEGGGAWNGQGNRFGQFQGPGGHQPQRQPQVYGQSHNVQGWG